MPPIHLLVKPSSGNCNMRCDYCLYYDITEHREQASYGFMSEETLEQMIKKALECAEGEYSFSYQGREPTPHDLAFFRKSLESEREHNIHGAKINHALQTNDYCPNEDWVKFLADNHFLVGVSLNGSRDTYNTYRRSVRGEKAFFDIMKAIDILNEYQVEFDILTVVNRRAAGKTRKIYQFYKRNHLNYLQFIPCLDPLGKQQGSREYPLTAEFYGEFLKDLFDLWYDDLLKSEQPYTRQLENYIAILMGYHPEACDQSGVCNYQYVMETDGEVYPCDLYVLDEYKLGNLDDCSIEDIDKERHEIDFMEYSLVDHEARGKCRHFLVCRGGCRRHHLLEEADGNHGNMLCDSYPAFFDHAMPRMADIARRLSRQSEPVVWAGSLDWQFGPTGGTGDRSIG